MNKPNRNEKTGTDQQVIQGIKKDLQSMTTLALGATSYTPTSLVAFIQSHIDAANAVVIAKANWENAIKTYAGIDKQAQVVLHDLKQLVMGAFGATSSKLADFGYQPRKVTVLTPEQKAAAAAKRAATRKARGTMGPKAKLKVTGTTAAASTASTAAPAPAASNAPAATPPSPAPAAAPAAAQPAGTGTQSVTVNVNPASASPQGASTTGTSGASETTTQGSAAPAAAPPAPKS